LTRADRLSSTVRMDVFFSTGEKSGDQTAAAVAAALRRAFGEKLDMAGMVGPLSAGAGVRNILEGAGRSSAGGELRGFAAWARRLETAITTIRKRPPRLLVAVTHPTFNLPLAAAAPAGVRRIMIGPPEIWAWQANALGRAVAAVLKALPTVSAKPFSPVKAAHVAARRGPMALASFDDLLCLTPMNAAAYGKLKRRARAAVNVVHARHPAAELTRQACRPSRTAGLRKQLGLAENEHLLGVFPGSRQGEIRLLLPTMLRAAGIVASTRKDVRAVVSVTDAGLRPGIAKFAARYAASGKPAILTDAPSKDLLCACCHAILASGTLTLEAALLAAPATVAYTLPPTTRFVFRPLFRHNRIAGRPSPFALPNAILAWRGAAADGLAYREVTLRRFRPANIARAVLAGLPKGAHGGECPPLLPAGTVRLVREALCPAPESPSVEQYVVQALGQAM